MLEAGSGGHLQLKRLWLPKAVIINTSSGVYELNTRVLVVV